MKESLKNKIFDRLFLFPFMDNKLILKQKESIDYQINNHSNMSIFSNKSSKWNLTKAFLFLHFIAIFLIYFKVFEINYIAIGISFILYFILFIFILKGNKISIVLLGIFIFISYLFSFKEIFKNIKFEGDGVAGIVSMTFTTWYFLSMTYQIYIIERDKKS